MVKITGIKTHINGYGATFNNANTACPDTTTEAYALDQLNGNSYKVKNYLVPLLEKFNAKTVLDIGCGVGEMVQRLVEKGFEAYGMDFAGLTKYWSKLKLSPSNFILVDSVRLDLPFDDDAIDFSYTFGAIEHVGTSNGHARLMPDYTDIRKQWLREIFRITRKGGHILVGGPNRNFPIDVAHNYGLGSNASQFELLISRFLKASFHKTWGEYFLWGYKDFKKYLDGLEYKVEPLSIFGFLEYKRVPRFLQPLVRYYTKNLPKPLLGTGLNPWVMALIKKL